MLENTQDKNIHNLCLIFFEDMKLFTFSMISPITSLTSWLALLSLQGFSKAAILPIAYLIAQPTHIEQPLIR
jgi:hypothetical protein